jgi:hypothetical protein
MALNVMPMPDSSSDRCLSSLESESSDRKYKKGLLVPNSFVLFDNAAKNNNQSKWNITLPLRNRQYLNTIFSSANNKRRIRNSQTAKFTPFQPHFPNSISIHKITFCEPFSSPL